VAKPRRDVRRALILALPPILALAVGALTLDGGFVFDDSTAIVDNPVVNGEVGATAAFTRGFWGEPLGDGAATYRPLTPLLWRAVYALGGGSPLPFRWLSMLAHALSVMALLFCAERASVPRVRAMAMACLFALHGVGAEATAAIVGHADLLSTAAGLCALGLAFDVRALPRGLVVAAIVAAACLFKESAVVFGIAAVVVIHLKTKRPTLWLAAAAVVLSVVAFQLSMERPAETTTWNNSLSYDAHGIDQVLLGLHNLARGLGFCFVPIGLAPSHGFAAIDLSPETLAGPAVMGGLLLALGAAGGAFALRKRDAGAAALTMVLFGTPLLGAGLFFPVMTDLAERLLYPASAAASALLVLATVRYLPNDRGRAVAWVVLALYLFAPSLSLRRAWRSDASLWAHAVEIEPRAVRHQWNHANALVNAGRPEQAAFHRMVALYLVNGYPDGVEWQRIEALAARPPREAIVEGPDVLYDDPCPMVISLSQQLAAASPAYFTELLPELRARYAACGNAPSD